MSTNLYAKSEKKVLKKIIIRNNIILKIKQQFLKLFIAINQQMYYTDIKFRYRYTIIVEVKNERSNIKKIFSWLHTNSHTASCKKRTILRLMDDRRA